MEICLFMAANKIHKNHLAYVNNPLMWQKHLSDTCMQDTSLWKHLIAILCQKKLVISKVCQSTFEEPNRSFVIFDVILLQVTDGPSWTGRYT